MLNICYFHKDVPKKASMRSTWSLTMILLVLLFWPLDAAMADGYREYEDPPCYDITGSTTPVLVGGVNNGGLMRFLAFDDPEVDGEYQACVRMSTDWSEPDHLEGWVWNDNLGWVSLYCGISPGPDAILGTADDVNDSNLGINCGPTHYQVDFDTVGTGPDFTTVRLDGFAWGENIGWIQFNVPGFSQIELTGSGAGKGWVMSDDSERHAWTNSVGWLDFNGVRFPWEDLSPEVPIIDVLDYVSVCSRKDFINPLLLPVGQQQCNFDLDGTSAKVGNVVNVPYAKGLSNVADNGYWFEVGFFDTIKSMLIFGSDVDLCASDYMGMYEMKPGTADYCVKLRLDWEDDIDMDQTLAGSQSQGSSAKYNVIDGAVENKPLELSDLGVIARDTYETNFASRAPSSDMNITDGMPNEKFYYYNSSDLGAYDPDLDNQNLLKLRGINLLFFEYSKAVGEPGVCHYGEIGPGADPNPLKKTDCMIFNYMNLAPYNETLLSFRPLVSTDNLIYRIGADALKYITLQNQDGPQKFEVGAFNVESPSVFAAGWQAVFKIGLTNDFAYDLKFVDSMDDLITDGVYEKVVNQANNDNPNIVDLVARLFNKETGQTVDHIGPYLYSKISYTLPSETSATVYWGPKLPRVAADVLINPVAKVEGNVYLTDYAQKAKNVEDLESLGNVSSNLRREVISRNVERYKRGYEGTFASGGASYSDSGVMGMTELVDNEVYYLKDGNLRIGCGPLADEACTFNNDITFIVEGGNIFVDGNVETPTGAKVGLIALRDLSNNSQPQGFLYLSEAVTWMQNVHVYVDRIMQSNEYNNTAGISSINGLSLFYGDDAKRQNFFNNQFVFEGTLSSMNGIGNANAVPPTDETGQEVSGTYCAEYSDDPLEGICRAKVADLNYLRYFGPGLEICPVGTTSSGYPRDQELYAAGGGDPNAGCDINASGYYIDAHCLYSATVGTDSGPTCDLKLGATGGNRSDYFVENGLPETFENSFPVNFFYRPIGDLKGFEREAYYDQI